MHLVSHTLNIRMLDISGRDFSRPVSVVNPSTQGPVGLSTHLKEKVTKTIH